jgi:adapter protein MecA 1/2
MRIERVDDTTVKLFITYSDIEARGFSREDLWTIISLLTVDE